VGSIEVSTAFHATLELEPPQVILNGLPALFVEIGALSPTLDAPLVASENGPDGVRMFSK
jgi:hypothetical protein